MSHAPSCLCTCSLLAASLRRAPSGPRPIATVLGALVLLAVPKPVTAFERIGSIELESGEAFLDSPVIDLAGAFAYFGTGTSPGRVVKIDLASFAPVGALELEDGESGLLSALIDPAGVFAYFGTATSPGRVIKIGLLPAQELAFDPESLDFGDVLVGETSVPLTAMLSNTGDADATGVSCCGGAWIRARRKSR